MGQGNGRSLEFRLSWWHSVHSFCFVPLSSWTWFQLEASEIFLAKRKMLRKCCWLGQRWRRIPLGTSTENQCVPVPADALLFQIDVDVSIWCDKWAALYTACQWLFFPAGVIWHKSVIYWTTSHSHQPLDVAGRRYLYTHCLCWMTMSVNSFNIYEQIRIHLKKERLSPISSSPLADAGVPHFHF